MHVTNRRPMTIWRWLALTAFVACVLVNPVPAPTQPPGGEEGNGCGWSGHLAVVPQNMIYSNLNCQDVSTQLGQMPNYPDQRVIWASNSTVTTACPGRDVWVDIHVTRFNVDGVQDVIGTITFDEDHLTFFGYQATDDYTYWSSVERTSPGVLSVYLTANVNVRTPNNSDYIAARILFKAVSPLMISTRVSLWGLHAFSSYPTEPYHNIPDREVCRRDSDIHTVSP